MSVSVRMPQLGESVTEGTVTRWLKKEGDLVKADEPLLEVSTDKVDTEIPSPAAGVLRGISVAEEETVEVGAELAVIDEQGSEPAGAPSQPAQFPEHPAAPPQAAPLGLAPDAGGAPAPEPSAPGPPGSAPPPLAPQAPPPLAPQPPPTVAPQAPPAAAPQQPFASPTQLPSGGDGPYITPLVRKLAAEHGVDLGSVEGTGVGGRIRKQDVIEASRALRSTRAPEATAPYAPPSPPQGPQPVTPAPAPAAPPTQAPQAAPSPAAAGTPAAVPGQLAPQPAAPADRPVVEPSPLRGTTERMSRLRQVIAQRMVDSLHTSAQLTTVVETDVTKIARLRQRAKADFEAREGVRLSFLPFFALAALEALKMHPKLNAVIDTERAEVTYHDAEHLGIAVDTERGLLVPVIRNAGDLNIGGLARKIDDLARRTRSGQVSPDELSGGTFTLTNTGSRGALFDTPIINQPQVAILGTGAAVKRPVVVDDPALGEVIAVRSMVYLALTYDHRLVDGADAARFLVAVRSRLEEGTFEAELGL
jgi:pyruvate dehydrogenase E2 component (dihydrolipoyllysine-residue acetyltransferase)